MVDSADETAAMAQIAPGGQGIIRKAVMGDAEELSKFAERTFREAFSAVNAAEDMDLHCRIHYARAVLAQEIADASIVTLLSQADDGSLVGFAQLRWYPAPECVTAESPGEIQRLYVLNECHGTGTARDLMQACIEEMRYRGSDVVWLGVWEQNPRAIAFYRKHGFVEVGRKVFALGRDPQRDLVMARPVSNHDSVSGAPQ